MASRDIAHLDDIKLLVDTFYSEVRKDLLIGPIFTNIIKDNWPAHLDKMYRFWQTILLDEVAYSGSPFLPHAKLPLEKNHFEAWMAIWQMVVKNLFTGPKADEALWRAEKMAEMFQYKLAYYKENPAKPLI